MGNQSPKPARIVFWLLVIGVALTALMLQSRHWEAKRLKAIGKGQPRSALPTTASRAAIEQAEEAEEPRAVTFPLEVVAIYPQKPNDAAFEGTRKLLARLAAEFPEKMKLKSYDMPNDEAMRRWAQSDVQGPPCGVLINGRATHVLKEDGRTRRVRFIWNYSSLSLRYTEAELEKVLRGYLEQEEGEAGRADAEETTTRRPPE